MKTARVSLALLLTLGVIQPVFSATSDGGRPGAFLDYAASARSLGMGQAFTAVSDDASAVYFNPSGVALMRRQNLVAQFSTLLESSSIGFIGYARPLEHNGGIGVGFVTLNSGDITRRDDLGNKSGSYNTTSSAGLLSGAFAVAQNLSIGSTAKIIRETVAEDSAVGFGLDLSAMLRASDRFRVGLMGRNLVAPSVKLGTSAEKFARSVTLGIAAKPVEPITVGLDFEKPSDGSVRPKLGAEYLFNDVLALRGGVQKSEFSVGLGLGLGDWNFDYALGYARSSSEVRDLGAFHRFGIQFNFGLPVARPVFTETVPRVPSAPRAEVAKPAKPAKAGAPVAATKAKAKPAKAAAAVSVVAAKPRTAVHLTPAVEALHALGEKMDTWDGLPSPELQRQVDNVGKALRKGQYLKVEDIYAAQGYVSYFYGEYATSARSLEKAADANPSDPALAKRAQKARDQVIQAAAAVKRAPPKDESAELRAVREKYEAADWNGTIVLAQRILETSPNNKEAASYQKRALDRLVQPRLRQAKDFLDTDRFVESFILFQKVIDYDPDNKEAQAYSARVVQIIEKKSDMDSSSRAVPHSDAGVQQGLALFQKGLRLYAHGDIDGARNAWENALLQVKSYPLVYDTVRATLVELGHPPR